MATNATIQDLSKISQYLWSTEIAKNNAFTGGSINNGRDLALYIQRKALDYGLEQSLDGITGVATMVYTLCGSKLQLSNQVLVNGSGGIVNPTTGAGTTLTAYRSQFVIGGTGDLFGNGGTVATINIGAGNNFLTNSIQVSLDQSILPQNDPSYISYTVSYAAGIVTITLNQAAVTNQLYIITFDYIIA